MLVFQLCIKSDPVPPRLSSKQATAHLRDRKLEPDSERNWYQRNKSEFSILLRMDEGRKRVLAIEAGILVARHLKTADDLFDTRVEGWSGHPPARVG